MSYFTKTILCKIEIALFIFVSILSSKVSAQENYIETTNVNTAQANAVIDSSFEPSIGFAGRVLTAVKQNDGKLIVAGLFSSANGVLVTNFARFLENGDIDPAFKPPFFGDSINTLATQPDGKNLVAFSTTINGSLRSKIVRLNQDGSLDASFDTGTGTGSSIRVMVVLPDGHILVGGSFSEFNGTSHRGLIRLNSDGSVDQSYTVQASGFNNSILSTGQKKN